MTINNVDVSTFSVKQHKVTIGHADPKNESEWVSAALLPHMSAGYIGFKTIDIQFIVKGADRETIIANRSKLLAALMNPCTLALDGFTHKFKAVLKSHKENEVSMYRWHTVTATMLCYEYGTEVGATGTGSVSATNPGTIVSPVELKITPAANATNVTISGLCRNPRTGADMPVTLGTVTQSRVIILDGANGIFTEGGSLKTDIDIQYPPCVAPGAVGIACSAPTAGLQLTILPLYM